MNKLIPKSFTLYGEDVSVTHDPDRCRDLDCLGACNESINEIVYSDVNSQGYKRTIEGIEQTFLHELVHVILFKMNEDDLSKNEKFVDTFSRLLHQYLKTAKY